MKKGDYNSKIKLYYKDDLDKDLIDKVIDLTWKLKKIENASDFELVRDIRKEAKVYRFTFKNNNYYLKTYFYTKKKKLIKNLIRGPEAIRHFKTSNKLLNKNIPIVQPVISAVKRKSFLKKESVFVTKEFPGIELEEFLLKSQDKEDVRIKLIDKLAKLWADLINNNFLHQDPALSNFLINQEDRKLNLSLVDVDNIYPVPLFLKAMVVHSFARFEAKLVLSSLDNSCKILTYDERKELIKRFISYYNKELEMDYFLLKVKELTLDKLFKWKGKNRIDLDEVKDKFYD